MKNKLLFICILSLSLLFDIIPASAQNIPDFLVNEQGSINGAKQSTPSIDGDGNGNYVITWQDKRNGSNFDIFSQIYLSNDTTSEYNFKVNDDGGIADQTCPAIAVDPNLNFVIAWVDKRNGDWNVWDVYAQRFSNDGIALGNNFKVNDDTGVEKKDHINVSIDSCGNFVIVWSDERNEDWDIYAQRFSNDGTALESNFKINDDNGNSFQFWPSSSCDKNGNMVVSWADNRNNNGREIFAQRFSADGTALGNNFKVNTDLYGSNHIRPSIAIDGNSNFIIVWEDNRNGYDDIYAQRYLADGTTIDDNFKINDDTPNASQCNPSISSDLEGNFVVSWEDNRHDYNDVYARRYSNDGTPIAGDFKVNSSFSNSIQFNAAISSDANGNFIICWEHNILGLNGDIFAQFYLNDGTTVGDNFKVNDDTGSENQDTPSIAKDGNDNFIITWVDDRSGKNAIYAQRFMADGTALGDNFRVNDITSNSSTHMPSVAANKDGDFVICWADFRNGDCLDIYAQHYTENGTPVGNNFLVNNISACMNFIPAVVFKNNGDFIITWSDAGEGSFDNDDLRSLTKMKVFGRELPLDSKGSEPDVYAQQYFSDGTPIGENFLVNDDIINTYQENPAIVVDTNGNFIIAWQDNRNGPWHIYLQRYLSDGTPLGENFKVEDILYLSNQMRPSISIDDLGTFSVAWSDYRNNNVDIFCRRFLNDGTPIGNSFQVNNISGDSYMSFPDISARENGDFVITWSDNRNGNYDIFAQRYLNSGLPLGSNFRVSESDDMEQLNPKVFFGNNRIYTSWQDNRGGQTGFDIWANILDWGNSGQEIILNEGFHFISSRIEPIEPDMLVVLSEVLNDNLGFVRNSLGQTLLKIGPNWINGIGDWIVSEGYLVKMFADDSFSINGLTVNPSTPISLEAGFQFVSYFPETSMDALLAFETIMDENLDYIRNSQGQTLRKIGQIWVNGIGDCQPGEGYLIKMFAADEIIYPASAKSSGKTTIAPTYFSFEGGNPAEPVYTIYLRGLEIGDEIAGFDGDIMVGALSIRSENVFENSLALFSTLTNKKGYTPGNQIELRVWNVETHEILDMNFNMEYIYDSYVSEKYPSDDGKYSIVNVLKGSMISDEEILVFPNPATENISIISQNEIIKVSIFNCFGQSVYERNINDINIQINTSDFEAGIYFIRIETTNGLETHKVTTK